MEDPVIPFTEDHLAYKQRQRDPITGELPKPDPRCPKCGYTMCELFDYAPMTAVAMAATPNGKYQCYRCTPVKA